VPDATLLRLLGGLVVSSGIGLAARRARSLSPSGAMAAVVVGTACMTAGLAWGALLILFFVSSSALSRWGREARSARVAGVVAKGDERDAWQVAANGGVFAMAALGSVILPGIAWEALGAGALAASAADTWATEVGTLAGGMPRSVLSGRPMARGMSGGVTWIGTLASVAGAALIAAGVLLSRWGTGAALGALIGGVAGSLADSVLGATVQERRRCPACDRPTERLVHDCGSATVRAGGVPGLRNDAVNVACTAAGGLVGWWMGTR
jgi:uncharacterized protein (TIGR00297 family)